MWCMAAGCCQSMENEMLAVPGLENCKRSVRGFSMNVEMTWDFVLHWRSGPSMARSMCRPESGESIMMNVELAN